VESRAARLAPTNHVRQHQPGDRARGARLCHGSPPGRGACRGLKRVAPPGGPVAVHWPKDHHMAARSLRFRLAQSPYRSIQSASGDASDPTPHQPAILRVARAFRERSHIAQLPPIGRAGLPLAMWSVEDVGGANRSKRPIGSGVARRRARRSALDTRSSGLEHSSVVVGLESHERYLAREFREPGGPPVLREPEGVFIEQVGRSVHHAQDRRIRWDP
jgi:hypothetical protein